MIISNTEDNSQRELHELLQEVQSFAQNFEPRKTEPRFLWTRNLTKKYERKFWNK